MPYYLNEQGVDIQPNLDLSDLDKAFIMLNYPGRAPEDMSIDKALAIAGVDERTSEKIKNNPSASAIDYEGARQSFITYNEMSVNFVAGKPYSVDSLRSDFQTDSGASQREEPTPIPS